MRQIFTIRWKVRESACPWSDKHPSVQAFAADQGYWETTVALVQEWLSREEDIISKPAQGFEVILQCWIVERTFAWLGNFRRLANDFEIRTDSAENMIRIAMLKVTAAKCAKL
jgi:putative transposase